MARWKLRAAPLVGAIDHFLRVMRSYWGGSLETVATAAISSFFSNLLGSTGAEITPANFAVVGFLFYIKH